LRQPPEREPYKILPVLFILSTIVTLYLIYTFAHLVPMLQLTEASNMVDIDMRFRGLVEFCIFNFITLMLITSYVRCILVHPGEVPSEAPWLYTTSAATAFSGFKDTKKNGERRHCKWCGKYKPDRCHHCRVCNMCILKMDHHCPWIYNCVGFHNYKFFFLLLFYSMLDMQFILWTMSESMLRAIDENAPFLVMFFTLFGLTISFFLGTLVTLFFGFHMWLVMVGLSTIEFCEKKFPKKGDVDKGGWLSDCFDSGSPYDLGVFRNICSTLGNNPLTWLLPFSGSPGTGLVYEERDEVPSRRSFETGRGAKHGGKSSKNLRQATQLSAADVLRSYGLHGYGTMFQPAKGNPVDMPEPRSQRSSFGGKGGGAIWGGR